MHTLTTSFNNVLKMFVSELDPKMTPEARMSAYYGFVSGMQAGSAVLQNRMSVTAEQVAKLEPKEKARIMIHLADTCTAAQKELSELSMTMGPSGGTG